MASSLPRFSSPSLCSTFSPPFSPTPATWLRLLSHSQACNPFKNVSTFGITLINLFLNVTSGYWMAYRIRNEKVDEPDVESVQTDKKEEGAVSIPDEGEISCRG